MVRPSRRDGILAAALRVVDADGVAALTLDAVALAAGITKSGLLYHFRSREELLLAVHEHLAHGLSRELIECADGIDPGQLSPRQRLAAYTRASARSATGAELRLMLEAGSTPELAAPWEKVMRQWLPDPGTIDPDDPEALALMLAQFTADGLWMAGAVLSGPLPPALRARLAERAVAALEA